MLEPSIERINAVTNHPDVRPFLGAPELGYVDVADVLEEDPSLLVYEYDGGFVLFRPLEHDVWEIHVAFEPRTWGVSAFSSIQKALKRLFAEEQVRMVLARPPVENVRTVKACERHGFVRQDTRHGVAVFTLERGN